MWSDRVFVEFLLVFSASFSAVASQDTEPPTTLDPPPADDVICSTCACADGAVDCAGRDLKKSFSYEDWSSFLPQAPVLSLDISYNSLPVLTKFPKLPIQTLNASHCLLESLDDGCFSNLTELVTLDLSYNMLTTLSITRHVFMGALTPGQPPESFRLMRHLSLAHNDFHALPMDIFSSMKGISVLDLSGNPLAIIDQVTMAAISDLGDLRELKLSGCELETLPEGFLRRHPRLRRLDLSDNRFGTVPSVLAETITLQYLNLGKNPLLSIEGGTALTNQTKLEELHLTRLSRLSSVAAGALGGMGALKTLDLSHNPRLTTLDPLFLVWTDEQETQHWPEVKELFINNNNLSSIDSHFLDRWDLLRELDVTSNPFLCDCNMQWAVHTLPALLASANTTHTSATCKRPPDLRGFSLQYLHESQKTLACEQTESVVTAAEAEGIIFLGVIIGIFTAFPLVLVIMLVWKKGYFARCRRPSSHHYASEEELSNLNYR